MISSNAFLKRTIPIFIQNAQAHRKPRWLPVAKSKIYRIPKKPVISAEEKAELQRIHNNYKTQMRAVKRFYFEEFIKEKSTLRSASSEMSQKLEADEWAHCVKVNEEWNRAVAKEREKRRVAEIAEMEQYTLTRMEEKDNKRRAWIEAATAKIRAETECSTTFITPDTLEEAIDRALANPIDHNFAIDLKGNQYIGSGPIKTPTEQKNTA